MLLYNLFIKYPDSVFWFIIYMWNAVQNYLWPCSWPQIRKNDLKNGMLTTNLVEKAVSLVILGQLAKMLVSNGHQWLAAIAAAILDSWLYCSYWVLNSMHEKYDTYCW